MCFLFLSWYWFGYWIRSGRWLTPLAFAQRAPSSHGRLYAAAATLAAVAGGDLWRARLLIQRKDFNIAHNGVGDPSFDWAIDQIE